MNAVVVQVRVDPGREEDAGKILRERIVPAARARPGFVAGYWLRSLKGNVLRTVQIYNSADTAQAAARIIQSEGPPPGAPVTLDSVEVFDVIAHA